MEACHVVAVEVREFPRSKIHEMGVKHPPIIAGGAFAWRMPFKILLGQIPKGWLMEPILSDLRRIVALRDRPYMRRCQLARLIHGEWAIGPDREASHPPPNALFQDERLSPFGNPKRKAWQLCIAYKHLAR